MSTQILMPALSPTMTEGKLSRWLKNVGDEVHAGDVIAEIETDKATMEVEAVDEGKLAQILVDEGTEGVAVNTPIALLAANGEDPGRQAQRLRKKPPALKREAPASRKSQRRPKIARRSRNVVRRVSAGPPLRRRPRRRRIGARPNQSPCAKPCVMPWHWSCGATTRCS